MTNHYQTLGVSQDATDDDIKKAYRKLARKLHPDVSDGPDAAEQFKAVSHAYEVLSDPQKRRVYDMTGDENGNSQGFGAGHPGGINLGDIFDMFAGGGMRQGPLPRTQRGQDALVRVDVDLEDVVFGTQKKIEVDTAITCGVCSGSCLQPGTTEQTCGVCHGTGHIQQAQRTLMGTFMTTNLCSACQGHGTTLPHPCIECSGQGRVRSRKTLTVKIPAGVNTGNRIQLSGQGEVGPGGGPAGDLYLETHVKPHEAFTRHGDDLHAEISVPMTSAALGTTLTFNSFDGNEPLEIKPGTQTGETLTLKGKGVGSLRRQRRGDLMVHIHVETPTRLTDEQRELLERLATARGEESAPGEVRPAGKHGLFSKFKEKLSGL